jgi:hypothetical protein
VLGLVLPTSGVRAQVQSDAPAPHARLVLDAGTLASRCISQAELEQSVQAQLGRVAFVEPASAASLEVRVRLVQSEPGHFRASITSGAPAAEAVSPPNAALGSEPAPSGAARELEATGDCRALDEQLALVVALLVDADPATSDTAEPKPIEPEPEPESPPVQDTSPVSSAPAWESKPAGPWHFALGASGVVAFGLLPQPGLGLGIDAALAPPDWPGLRLRVLGFLPGEASVTDESYLALTFAQAGLAVCPKLAGTGRFTLAGCLGADVTFLNAESHGLADGQRSLRVGGQVGASLVGSFALGAGFRALAEVGTSFPFFTERYTVDHEGERQELFRTPFGPLLLSLGAVYDFR